MLHFPNDTRFDGNDTEKKGYSSTFMMGGLIYFAPILKCGVIKSKVYLSDNGTNTHEDNSKLN